MRSVLHHLSVDSNVSQCFFIFAFVVIVAVAVVVFRFVLGFYFYSVYFLFCLTWFLVVSLETKL